MPYNPLSLNCNCANNAHLEEAPQGLGWILEAVVTAVAVTMKVIEATSDDTKKSWGASTYPGKELERASNHIAPFANKILGETDATNLSENLTELDQFLQFMFTGSKHLREHHSNAKSTKRAHEEVMVYIQNLRANAVDGMIKTFQDKGFKVRTEPIFEDFNALEDVYDFYGGRKFDTSHKYTVESRLISVLAPEEDFTGIAQQDGVTSFEDGEGNTIYQDDSGNILDIEEALKKKAPQQAGFGMGGIVVLLGLALGAMALNKSKPQK